MPALWVVPEELEISEDSPYSYEACKAASYVLWAFSGRKFHGLRTVTERYECPCRSSTLDRLTIRPYMPGDGQIYNQLFPYENPGNCTCSGTIGGRHMRLRLRGNPVRSVQEVKKDGVLVDAENYKIVNSSLLQLTGTSLDVCGLEVTYTYGVNVPVAGRRAARGLATELVKGWSGGDCALPDRVTNVNREGLSMTIMDPQDFLDDGRTGVYEVDLFLRASNPDKARKPSRVFSPDLPKAFRVTSGPASVVLGPSDWQVTPGEAATWSVNLAEVGAEIVEDTDWHPQGQITTWNGATLLEFDPARFDITNGVLTVSLTAEETTVLSGNTAAWDLYAVSAVDGYTLVHVLSSTIYLTGV